MDDSVVITLFRHGLTEANEQKRYLGWSDSPLCEGTVIALAHANCRSKSYDAFYSSDLERCVTTMKTLFPQVSIQCFNELRELNFGDFEGQTYEELRHNDAYAHWLDDIYAVSPPQGESFQEFSARIQRGWKMITQRIIDYRIRKPFIVTHGGVIQYLLSQYAPDKRGFFEWKVAHGSGYELVFTLSGLRRGERCISLQEVPITAKENG